jgi:hypothetical protein
VLPERGTGEGGGRRGEGRGGRRGREGREGGASRELFLQKKKAGGLCQLRRTERTYTQTRKKAGSKRPTRFFTFALPRCPRAQQQRAPARERPARAREREKSRATGRERVRAPLSSRDPEWPRHRSRRAARATVSNHSRGTVRQVRRRLGAQGGRGGSTRAGARGGLEGRGRDAASLRHFLLRPASRARAPNFGLTSTPTHNHNANPLTHPTTDRSRAQQRWTAPAASAAAAAASAGRR